LHSLVPGTASFVEGTAITTAFQVANSVREPSPLSKITMKSAKRQCNFMVQEYRTLGFLSRWIPGVSSLLLQSKYLWKHYKEKVVFYFSWLLSFYVMATCAPNFGNITVKTSLTHIPHWHITRSQLSYSLILILSQAKETATDERSLSPVSYGEKGECGNPFSWWCTDCPLIWWIKADLSLQLWFWQYFIAFRARHFISSSSCLKTYEKEEYL